MTSRKLIALVLALVAPWGTGQFHYGHRLRAIAWLAVPMIAIVTFGALLPRVGHAMGWKLACALPFIMLLFAWIGSVIDLFVIREGAETRWWQTVLFACVGVALPVIVAIGLRVLVLEAFRVPSESMEPSILAGDHLFVDKTDRRARYGDLVVFVSPDDASLTFVKRVIARPGDFLEMKRGRPWINGWEVPSCSLGRATLDTATGELVVEFLDDASYLVFYGPRPIFEHAGPFYTRTDGYLVLGDDRNDSFDSRMFRSGLDGNVHHDAMRGRAVFVWMRRSARDDAQFGIDLGIASRPHLPSSLASLTPALDACMAKRPISRPPPPSALSTR